MKISLFKRTSSRKTRHYLPQKPQKKGTGFTLIETLVGISVMLIIFLGVFAVFQLGIKLTAETKKEVTAASIAQERIEMIRNLPYANVGTINGVPTGDIPQQETVNRNGIDFNLKTTVVYIDDPADGLIGADPPNQDQDSSPDYKQVTVEVTWSGKTDPLILSTNIAPKNLAPLPDKGTLSITVLNASGEAVPLANVHVENLNIDPQLSADYQTTTQGKVVLPGLEPYAEGYEIYVSKDNYNSDQTYDRTEELPNPDKPHATITANELTEITFNIDLLCSKNISFENEDGDPVAALPFKMHGQKTIGLSPQGDSVYKYDEDLITQADGSYFKDFLEWDSFEISIDNEATGYDISYANPPQPATINPGENIEARFILVSHAQHTLLVTVVNGLDEPVASATVRLYKTSQPSYDETKESRDNGQAFFTPLSQDKYKLDITASGYEDFLDNNVDVDGQTQITVKLAAE